MARNQYDCSKCPGYCCSYPVIEVKDRDAKRIAKHFDLPLEKAEKKFFKSAHGYKRIFKRKKDKIYGKVCIFFNHKKRNCGIYEARPGICREFPSGARCGYYDFLKFEREGQEDETYISRTNHTEN